MIGSWMSNKEDWRRGRFFLRRVEFIRLTIRGQSINSQVSVWGYGRDEESGSQRSIWFRGKRRQSKVRWKSRVQPEQDHQSTD